MMLNLQIPCFFFFLVNLTIFPLITVISSLYRHEPFVHSLLDIVLAFPVSLRGDNVNTLTLKVLNF